MRQRVSSWRDCFDFLIFDEARMCICILNTPNFEQPLARQWHPSSKSNCLLFPVMLLNKALTPECPYHYSGWQWGDICFSFQLTKKTQICKGKANNSDQSERILKYMFVGWQKLKIKQKTTHDFLLESCIVYIILAILCIFSVLF